MISTSIKFAGGISGISDPRVSVNNDALLTLGQERMQEIGEFALQTVKARVRRGIGSDDTAMPALHSPGYLRWKSRHGLQPIRDLTGAGKGGHMLDNLTVRSVSGSKVTMALTVRLARDKALANEKRTPWLSFSDQDQKQIIAFAAKAFGSSVGVVAQKLRSVWMQKAA
jgi:hypothetical protein